MTDLLIIAAVATWGSAFAALALFVAVKRRQVKMQDRMYDALLERAYDEQRELLSPFLDSGRKALNARLLDLRQENAND